MLTDLDAELFPDDCEVVEILPHNRHIYLIQKNGSSSLRLDAEKKHWKILKNQEIYDCEHIDVYLRDPVQRYVSGVNTFVQHLMRDYPTLDKATCEDMAARYCFLNRHYLPQWHWLVNLARFIRPDCVIQFRSINDLDKITSLRSRAGILPLSDHASTVLLSKNPKLELWFLLDKILLGYCGQALTWQQILDIYHAHPAQPMLTIMDRMVSIHHVLR